MKDGSSYSCRRGVKKSLFLVGLEDPDAKHVLKRLLEGSFSKEA